MQDGTALDIDDAAAYELAQRPQLRLTDVTVHPRQGSVRASDPSCRGRGTERVGTTTTTITSDPAPAAPAAGHSAVLDLLDAEIEEIEEIDDGDRTVVTAGPVRPGPYWPAPDPGDTVVRRATAVATDQHGETQATTRVDAAADPVAPTPRAATRTRHADAGTIIGIGPWRPAAPERSEGRNDRPVTSPPAPSSRARTLVVTPEPERTAQPQLRAVVLGRYLGDAVDTAPLRAKDGDALVLGRTGGSPFAEDPYLERCHASLTATAHGVRVEDFGSLNGVFVRLMQPTRLHDGDLFRIGHELLSFRTIETSAVRRSATRPLGCPDPGYWARISAMLTPDCPAATYPIDDVEAVLGREQTHLQFPDDDFVDAEHCRITTDDHGPVLEDLGSEHGTFLRVRSGNVVPYGSVLLVGQTLVRVDGC